MNIKNTITPVYLSCIVYCCLKGFETTPALSLHTRKCIGLMKLASFDTEKRRNETGLEEIYVLSLFVTRHFLQWMYKLLVLVKVKDLCFTHTKMQTIQRRLGCHKRIFSIADPEQVIYKSWNRVTSLQQLSDKVCDLHYDL